MNREIPHDSRIFSASYSIYGSYRSAILFSKSHYILRIGVGSQGRGNEVNWNVVVGRLEFGSGKLEVHGYRHVDSRGFSGDGSSCTAGAVSHAVGGDVQSRRDQSHNQALRRVDAGVWHAYACRAKVGEDLPDAGKCFSTAGRISDRAHLWAG